jgi:F0F1-type ATP synthase assembly protein I
VGTWVVPTAYLLGIGWFFATALIAGVGIGYWADSKTGLEPTFTLIGIFLGLAVALYGGARMLMPFMRRYGSSGPSEKD